MQGNEQGGRAVCRHQSVVTLSSLTSDVFPAMLQRFRMNANADAAGALPVGGYEEKRRRLQQERQREYNQHIKVGARLSFIHFRTSHIHSVHLIHGCFQGQANFHHLISRKRDELLLYSESHFHMLTRFWSSELSRQYSILNSSLFPETEVFSCSTTQC